MLYFLIGYIIGWLIFIVSLVVLHDLYEAAFDKLFDLLDKIYGR